jgi:hypothetical protein
MPIFKKIYKGTKKPKNNREMSKFDKNKSKKNKNNFNKQKSLEFLDKCIDYVKNMDDSEAERLAKNYNKYFEGKSND